MRLISSALAFLLLTATAAPAAETFEATLYTRSDLGPQAANPATPIPLGQDLRLGITAQQDITLSIVWQSARGEPVALLNDTRLSKGQSLASPWVPADSGGLATFRIFTTDAAGRVDESSVAALILEPALVAFDQPRFARLAAAKDRAEPAGEAVQHSYAHYSGRKELGFAAQLAKVPTEPPTFASGSALFKRVADGVVLVLTNDGLGSGSLISEEGEIITNWHVVKGYDTVGVVFRPPQGTPLREDMILLADVVKVSDKQDLALLKLRQRKPGAPVLTLGAITEVDIGNEVHAVGHPLGESWTYTRGYVSQIRDGYQWSIGLGVQHEGQVIQTQTPINPGNSGGPLFDDDGKVIGVNTFGAPNAQGINYAVSIEEVKRFLAGAAVAESKPAAPQPAAPQPAAPQPATAPQPEPEFYALDLDNDGRAETYAADLNGDGLFDLLIIDADGDGQVDEVQMDLNYNGVIDARMVPVQEDGRWIDVWIIDENEDGKADYYGLDRDRDGTVDEWRNA